MKCTKRFRRYGDEYQCECGINWGVDEERPPCNDIKVAKVSGRVTGRELGLDKIAELRTRYFKK